MINTTGAGVARPPRHHVLPQEHRAFFEERGFTGDLDIDNFTVELETAHHQAQHGGGNWQMGREWPGAWNQLVMDKLRVAQAMIIVNTGDVAAMSDARPRTSRSSWRRAHTARRTPLGAAIVLAAIAHKPPRAGVFA